MTVGVVLTQILDGPVRYLRVIGDADSSSRTRLRTNGVVGDYPPRSKSPAVDGLWTAPGAGCLRTRTMGDRSPIDSGIGTVKTLDASGSVVHRSDTRGSDERHVDAVIERREPVENGCRHARGAGLRCCRRLTSLRVRPRRSDLVLSSTDRHGGCGRGHQNPGMMTSGSHDQVMQVFEVLGIPSQDG